MSESRKWALIKYKYCTKTNIFFLSNSSVHLILRGPASPVQVTWYRAHLAALCLVCCAQLLINQWRIGFLAQLQNPRRSKIQISTNSHPTRPQHRYQSTINSLSQLHVLHVFYNWNSASDLFNPWSLIRTLVWYKWTTLLRARDWENWLLARI